MAKRKEAAIQIQRIGRGRIGRRRAKLRAAQADEGYAHAHCARAAMECGLSDGAARAQGPECGGGVDSALVAREARARLREADCGRCVCVSASVAVSVCLRLCVCRFAWMHSVVLYLT